MKRSAFTMLELIFVIVVMGILAKFGVELLAKMYDNYIYNNVNSSLQEKSQNAVEMIASRLQYRIKSSIIARQSANDTNFTALSTANSNSYNILEWIGSDIDGFRGTTKPLWSGIIDLDDSNATVLKTPETNTTALNTLINALSNGDANLSDNNLSSVAIYFPGSNTNIKTGYGWDTNTTTINKQEGAMHPVQSVSGQLNQFASSTDHNFSGVDVYEYYKLAWTAYAVGFSDYNQTSHMGTLTLWYNYRPWKGQKYTDGNSTTLMDDVSTFRFRAIGSVVQIQVCTKSDLIKDEEYSICKEKTVF